MSDIMILSAGERCVRLGERIVKQANRAGMDLTLVNARFAKPLDGELLSRLPAKHVITLEDNVRIGGFGDMVARFYGGERKVYSFGYSDSFIPHGEADSLARKYGLDEDEILRLIGELYARG